MASPIDMLGDKLKALTTGWTAYTAFGSFVLYFVGYFTLRFHLTMLGLGTDLPVLDERYVFAGAKFAVYLVSAVPIVILLVLLAIAALYVPLRLMPTSIREGIATRWKAVCGHSVQLMITGIIISILMIQMVMRQCFFYSNLLLASNIPEEPAWLAFLMSNDSWMPLFFSGLIAGTVIPGVILIIVLGRAPESEYFKLLRALLAFLVAVQILLLPVNYGVLILDKSLPRVSSVGNEPVAEGKQAWLVWEGKEGMTYLVRRVEGNIRSLLTIPHADVRKIEIMGYDRVVPDLVPIKKEHRE